MATLSAIERWTARRAPGTWWPASGRAADVHARCRARQGRVAGVGLVTACDRAGAQISGARADAAHGGRWSHAGVAGPPSDHLGYGRSNQSDAQGAGERHHGTGHAVIRVAADAARERSRCREVRRPVSLPHPAYHPRDGCHYKHHGDLDGQQTHVAGRRKTRRCRWSSDDPRRASVRLVIVGGVHEPKPGSVLRAFHVRSGLTPVMLDYAGPLWIAF